MANFSPYHPLQLHRQQHQFLNINPNEAPPFSSSMDPSLAAAAAAGTEATLLVRHLPEAMPHEMLSRLFSHYGASSVRPCAGGKLRNCAFIDFKDEKLASQAQAQMNRLRLLGKVLSVDRVDSNLKNTDLHRESQHKKESSGPPALILKDSSNPVKSTYGSEPIAPRLGVDYPFPPHLDCYWIFIHLAKWIRFSLAYADEWWGFNRYDYPPPDGNILTNIVNALIAVPRFYTQVLHLMNKMNLPAPFRMALPTPPLPPPVPAPSSPPPPAAVEPPRADLSSEESEMESSEDDAGDNRSRKRVKREAIVGPAIDKSVLHEAVGLKNVRLVPKEVPVIKKKNTVLQIKINPKPTQKEVLDVGNGQNDLTEPSLDTVEQKTCATPDDLEKGKLPPEEILSLPMFKNYAPGNPAMVLYIKNLAKDVVAEDFYFIFGSLFGSVEAAKSGLHIKLMQEGRMRGQAFVTFPSIELAHRALNLGNGYVFKGKPMIIQFGRNPAASKTT